MSASVMLSGLNLRTVFAFGVATAACSGKSNAMAESSAAVAPTTTLTATPVAVDSSLASMSRMTDSVGKQPKAVAGDTTLMAVLERGPCHGRCPVYRVSVYGSGRVIFVGKQWVDSMGTRTHMVKPAAVRGLINAIGATPFSSVDTAFTMGSKSCGQYVPDLPLATLSAKVDGAMRRVYRDSGCDKAPRFLRALEAKVDTVARTAVWTTYSKVGAK